jgi:2-polyprenyl-3-methyl-5-hydroxy-6-metoxy-1,4-benzoquinol methylase
MDRNTVAEYQRLWGDGAFVAQYLSAHRLALYAEVARFALDALDGREGLWVADVGCGTGHMLKAALDAGVGAESVWGVDYAPNAIERARILLPTAKFLIEDLYETTLPVGIFDLVFCVETLEHLARYEAALGALMAFLDTGGVLVVTVPNGHAVPDPRHVNEWTLGEFQALLACYGDAHARLAEGGQYIIGRIQKC